MVYKMEITGRLLKPRLFPLRNGMPQSVGKTDINRLSLRTQGTSRSAYSPSQNLFSQFNMPRGLLGLPNTQIGFGIGCNSYLFGDLNY